MLGIRAYDTQKDVATNNKKLLDFVSAGGTLVVQYNASVGDFNAGKFTPYPAELSRARVSVEEAPVEILAPEDSVFHYSEYDYGARFRWMGAGARIVFHGHVGRAFHAAAVVP